MKIKITPAEHQVMKILWAQPDLAATEVADALAQQQDWNIRTIKTLLSRLVDKGALKTRRDGRRFLYTPCVAEHDYKTSEVGRLIDRLFEGRAAPLVAQLADSRGLTSQDIADLQAILNELNDEP